jgi:hypothetical protein
MRLNSMQDWRKMTAPEGTPAADVAVWLMS